MTPSTLKRQSGFTLIELSIGLVVLGAILIVANQALQKFLAKQAMNELAGEIAVVSNAVTAYVFDQGPAIPVGPTVQNGIDWLRDSSCGGPATTPPGQGYLSCNFSAPLAPKYGLAYQTTITRQPAANNLVTASINLSGPVNYRGEDRLDLSGQAMRVAKGAYANASTKNISDGTLDLYIDYQYDPATGAMAVVVDNGSDGSDPWLSITGQNSMQADLDMGDGSNDLVDAQDVFWGGTPTAAEAANNTQSALLADNGGGSTALRLNGRGGSGSEVIFIRDGTETTFNVRIANQDDGELLLEAENGVAVDAPVLDLIGGGGEGQMAADDFYSKATGRSLNQSVTDVFMANHDQLVPKPKCPTGLNPTIYTAVSRFAGVDRTTPNDLKPIAAFQARALDNGPTDWRIILEGIVQDDGVVIPPDDLAAVMAVTKCS
ncbi:type II secretion system protein [Marinobacter shengliensis]|uniref:type II secretion system protein n=1 Tax=Marinobacter shengliensis TaxID=1389223 RepID=UPI001108C2BC|nr:type II secretion system protein [Marinobacter shengliensis]